MKKIMLTIFVLSSTLIYSQNIKLSGVYKAGGNYLRIFPDSTLEFYTNYGSCILTDVRGYGTYTLKDSVIYLYTKDTIITGNSTFKIKNKSNDINKVEFEIHDDKGNIIPYVNVVVKGKKYLKGGCTNVDGNYEVTIDSNRYKFVEISLIGYDDYIIPVRKLIGNRITVSLMPYEILRNKNVIFKIRKTSSETSIIGPYFKNEVSDNRKQSNKKFRYSMRSSFLTTFRQDNK
jgi:hypothetical protein